MAVKCGACGADNEGWIPKERLDKVSEQRRGLKEQLANAQQALEDLQAETATASAQSEAKLQHAETLLERVTQLESEKAGWATERALMAAGVTNEEGVGIARLLWDRIPADDRPATVGEWLTSDAVPLAIKAYLPSGSAPADQAAAAPAEPAQAAPADQRINRNPPANRGATGTAPTAPIYTRESIAAVPKEEWAAHREQIMRDFRSNR